MDPIWLLLLLPVAAASGWFMRVYDSHSQRARQQIPEAYFKGLGFLLNEQPDKALQIFLQVVEVDKETIEMHLALGNLFRRRGEVERATHIHQSLIAHADLDDGLRSLASFELAQDYFKAGLFDRAESLFQQLHQTADYGELAGDFLLQIYDQEKEWQKAIKVAKSLARLRGQDLSETIAQYYCELAEKALTEGRNQQVETYLEAVFKHDPHCVRGVIQSGRSAAMRGNHPRAIATWRGLEYWAPDALDEVVDHLANSYQVLGDQEGFRKFLETAVDNNPQPRLVNALVELTNYEHGRKAGYALLLDLVKSHPSLEGLYKLLKDRSWPLMVDQQAKIFSLLHDTLAEVLADVVDQGQKYHCRKCGFNSSALHWQCPGCKAWGSVQKALPLNSRPT